jgi:glutamate racemase
VEELHVLLADSGLGGLAVCAAMERSLRACPGRLRLTYFNAAPDAQQGYNDRPDTPARAALLDRALSAMEALQPDRIVLACNTLSVLYEHTAHARRGADRVTGILEAGLRLFAGALAADPGGALLLLGTRTTIDSGAHRRRLLERGMAADRIGAISCHGLARAIEADPSGPEVRRLLGACAAALPALGLRGERLYAGLACTHYGYAGQVLAEALREAAGLPVRILNPNEALAEEVAAAIRAVVVRAGGGDPADSPEITVRVLSKVALQESSRRTIAGCLASVSALTARALLSYTCVPDLF